MQLRSEHNARATQLRFRALIPAVLLIAPSAWAQETESVDAHGFYYKETSTRVVTPHMGVTANIPQTGTTINANYLLDAITSASVAQGVSSDKALTEFRNQVGASVTQSVGPGRMGRVGASYLRSRESDYDSDTVGVTAAVDLFEKNTTWMLSYAHSFDTAYDRRAMRLHPVAIFPGPSLDTDFVGLSVSQILSETTVGMLGAEYAYQNGFQANPYRSVTLGAAVPEKEPLLRGRQTYYGRIAQLFPYSMTTLQLQYRFYTDDWQLSANSVEFRIYQDIARNVEGRIAYRFHDQGNAFFAKLPSVPGTQAYTACPNDTGHPTGCDRVYTSDPKLFAFSSHYLEFQLRYELEGVRKTPVLGWFEGGSVDLTVGIMYTGIGDVNRGQPTFGNCGPTDPTHSCAEKIIGLGVNLPL
jgi:uncharacterized protein DUF3570